MDLRCNKTNCKFNNQYACRAKEICVSNHIECKTFKKDSSKQVEKLSKTMFEQAPEIAPFRLKENVLVKCNAHCIFNKNGLCNANGITVLNEKYDAICGTFIDK